MFDNQPPLFVLSCARSGSTLLRFILDTHPNVCCPSEIELGGLSEKLFWAAYGTVAQSDSTKSNRDTEDVAVDEVRAVVVDLMNRYARQHGKGLWCEKSPSNVDHISMLDKVFPTAKYICLYRNCLDVVYSHTTSFPLRISSCIVQHMQNKYPGRMVPAVIDYWIEHTSKIMEFERMRSDRCFRTTYEDMVLKTDKVLGAMFAFLNVAWDSSMVRSVFTSHHDDSGGGDPKIWFTKEVKADNIGKGIRVPFDEIPRAFLSDVNELHKAIGYPTVEAYYQRYASYGSPMFGLKPCDEDVIGSDVDDLVRNNMSKLKDINGSCKLIVRGSTGGVWVLRPNEGGTICRDEDIKTDCTIIVSQEALAGIRTGQLNPVEAFYEGKVAINGDLDLAKRVGRLLLGW